MATSKTKKKTKSETSSNCDMIAKKVDTIARELECIQIDITSMARTIIDLEEKSNQNDMSDTSDLLQRIKNRLGL